MENIILGFVIFFVFIYLVILFVIKIVNEWYLCDVFGECSFYFVVIFFLGGVGIFMGILIVLFMWVFFVSY